MTVAMLGMHAFMHKWGGEMREKGRQCKNIYIPIPIVLFRS